MLKKTEIDTFLGEKKRHSGRIKYKRWYIQQYSITYIEPGVRVSPINPGTSPPNSCMQVNKAYKKEKNCKKKDAGTNRNRHFPFGGGGGGSVQLLKSKTQAVAHTVIQCYIP